MEIYKQLNYTKKQYIKMLKGRIEETNNKRYYFVHNFKSYYAHIELKRLTNKNSTGVCNCNRTNCEIC